MAEAKLHILRARLDDGSGIRCRDDRDQFDRDLGMMGIDLGKRCRRGTETLEASSGYEWLAALGAGMLV
jgi:hypothetical protein